MISGEFVKQKWNCEWNINLNFQALKAFSDGLKGQADFSSSEGEKEVNRKKNRYKDILPCKIKVFPIVPNLLCALDLKQARSRIQTAIVLSKNLHFFMIIVTPPQHDAFNE